MGEESSGQVQTLSMRLTTVLKGRLETMREVASLRRGGTVTTSDVAKGLLEAARDESLEVAEMHGRATEALLTIRQKVDHGQSLSHAEWMFVAHFVQLGTESFYKSPLRPESWSGLLEAFLALHSVRLEGPDRSGYYLSHLAGQTLEREPGDVRSAVMSLLERVRGGAKVHPSVGRALYGLLAGERFSGLASIQAALLPYWPVLWRVAARGHYGQRKTPIHKHESWEEMQERHSGSKAPGHREVIPPFLAGDYRLTVAESIEGDTLSLLLSLPGDHGPMYTMSRYPKIAEFLAMLEGLGPRTVDSRGNVRGDGLWNGETFFGYVVAGSSAEGYWFRDGALSLGFPPVGWGAGSGGVPAGLGASGGGPDMGLPGAGIWGAVMARPPVLRTKSATTKVTEAEYARLESLAEASGVNMSEWMRGRLLGRDGADRDEDTATVLGEVLALRTILINLLFSVSNGKPVTPEAMKELIEKADGDKARRAMERLTAAVPKMEGPTEGAEPEAGEAG